jgi:uncharacterized cupredoxin-like copper-binding protein
VAQAVCDIDQGNRLAQPTSGVSRHPARIFDGSYRMVLLFNHRANCSISIRSPRIKDDHMPKILRLTLTFVALLAPAACGSTNATSTTTQSFAVTAKEFSFAPAELTVTAGQPVELTLQNTGAVEHDWSVSDIDLAGNPTTTGETGGGHMDDVHDAPKLHVAAGPAAQGKLMFTPSKAGTYAVFCTVAGHKEAGMVGTLTVKAP